MWAMAKTIFALVLCVFVWSGALMAQAITVLPRSLDQALQSQLISEDAFYVNGPFTHGLTPEMAVKTYDLGPIHRTLLALVTLRLTAEGIINLDEPVATALPELLDNRPFRVAITPRHLLTETAGFAVPPSGVPKDWSKKAFYSRIRGAGQIAHTDAAGWQVLQSFLEAKTSRPIYEITIETVLQHLPGEGISLSSDMHRGSGSLIAEVIRLTVHNRDKNRGRFLPTDLYEQFALRQNWRMHPIDPRRTLGGILQNTGKRQWLSPPPITGSIGVSFMAFPDNGIAFITLTTQPPAHSKAVLTVAEDRFLPSRPDTRLREAQGIYDEGYRFNGLYVRSDAPTATLKDRLTALQTQALTLSDTGNNSLTVTRIDGQQNIYHKQAPFYYETDAGKRLILSPYRRGGYLLFEETIYRYIGPLGDKRFVIDTLPFAILILLTAAAYLKSKTSPRWRRMAQFAVGGTFLILAGIMADYYIWADAVYIWDMAWLVNIWRIMLNCGLAFILSVPLFAISFVRKNELPEGAGVFIAPLHLAALSIAAITLFLILVVWGLAGEFSAY